MLLGRRTISPGDARRYAIDYSGWLNLTETLSSFTFAVSVGAASVSSYSISSDGKSVVFYVHGATLATVDFNVTVAAVTSLSQTRNDHVAFTTIAS